MEGFGTCSRKNRRASSTDIIVEARHLIGGQEDGQRKSKEFSFSITFPFHIHNLHIITYKEREGGSEAENNDLAIYHRIPGINFHAVRDYPLPQNYPFGVLLSL